MKLTKAQKVYVFVLVLAVVAFMVDRVLLSPPEVAAEARAAARFAVAPSATALAAVAQVPQAGDRVSRQVQIARRLEALAGDRRLDPADVRDAFAPSREWLDAGLAAAGPGAGKSVSQRFREAHTLTAVMASGARGYAIVDGRTLFIGQALDGFTLISVGSRAAVLQSGSARVELTLPE